MARKRSDGRRIRASLIPPGWSSSTRPGQRRIWRHVAAGAARPAADRQGAAPPLAHPDLPGRLAPGCGHRACVFDGPINGRKFLAYVEQILAPVLKPGDIVVMDNLGSHKARRSAPRSAKPAPSCSSCRPIAPTSTPSSSSSPSSSTCYARPPNVPPRPPGPASAPSSTASPPNATTTSSMPAMHQPKPIVLEID